MYCLFFSDNASETPKKVPPEVMCPCSPMASVVPETEHQPSGRAIATPKMKPKRISQIMAGLETVGVRQSPRLAAIAKVNLFVPL